MDSDPRKVRAVFLAAVEKSSSGEQEAYLDQACAEDVTLRQRVEVLLRAHARSNSLVDDLASNHDAVIEEPSVSERPGAAIGPYTLLERIGEGGFGAVFTAEQTHPVRRKVALKVLKPGMDTRQVVARFEAERQALALMNHPNIAQIFDGGETTSGRPYFVMELVPGTPVTEFCDNNHLSLRQRLDLFVSVCCAVQHAHQKGIIHRDLKPSNILVTTHDTSSVVKVIDFGIAKATSQPLTDKTLHTNHSQMIGTPMYMSPEQAQMSGLDIDTRTDIYALGVLLYELLTGTTPFDKDRLCTATFDEMRRIIREEEPPKPSERLTTLGQAATTASMKRATDPIRLTQLLRGELDWIVMKALEKDRNRRYDNAGALAADVQRYMKHEAVHACPPTLGYQIRKFVRRHRGPVLAVSLVLLTLVAGIVGTTAGMMRAERLRVRAEMAETEAITQRDKAVAAGDAERLAKESAQKRLVQIEKGNGILKSIFKNLNPQVEEREGKPLRALLGEGLQTAVKQLELNLLDDPMTTAQLQYTLGVSLLGLGYPEQSVAVLNKARATFAQCEGPDHRDTLRSMIGLANGYAELGWADDALRLREETLALQRASLGSADIDTLQTMNNLCCSYAELGRPDDALKLGEQTLALRKEKLGPNHPDTLESMHNLANSYAATGRSTEALQLREETLQLCKAKRGPNHPQTLRGMSNLALSYGALGRGEDAVKLHGETLTLRKTTLGADHPDTLRSMNHLASSYAALGRYADAATLNEETLKLRKTKLGPNHPETLDSMHHLAENYDALGRDDDALKLREETLARRQAVQGSDHPNTLATMTNVAKRYDVLGRHEEAVTLREETLALRRATLGRDHVDTLKNMLDLADGYGKLGRAGEAQKLRQDIRDIQRLNALVRTQKELFNLKVGNDKWEIALPMLEKSVDLSKAALGPDHPTAFAMMNNVARCLQRLGKPELALPWAQQAAAGIEQRNFQDEYSELIVDSLCACHEQLKQYDQAEVWRRKWVAIVKQRSGEESARYGELLSSLGWSLIQQQKWSEAESVLRESLAIHQKNGTSNWSSFHTQALLGSALIGQEKYVEAEPQLLQAYERMDAARSNGSDLKLPLTEPLGLLVRLYDAWGQTDRASEWRAKQEAEQLKLPPTND
jgi:serine/threonine protein kinase/tetratricopeptide (TPR) repeat protein